MIHNRTFHPSFKLNNKSFTSVGALVHYAQYISEEVYTFLNDWFYNGDKITVRTSGSTGKPKLIPLNKEHMVNAAKATGEYFKLPERTTALACMPVHYIAGKMMLVRAMTLGWHLDIIPPTSNPLATVYKRYDFSAMVPMQLRASLKELHKIKKLIVGGGVVSPEVITKIQEVPTAIYATYGMTETITHIAVKKLNQYTIKKTTPAYQVLPHVTISQDKRGCLVIKAPNVSEEDIVTNDVVTLFSDKAFEWLGRYDHVINSGGVKLHPETIEEKLATIINERFFCCRDSRRYFRRKAGCSH